MSLQSYFVGPAMPLFPDRARLANRSTENPPPRGPNITGLSPAHAARYFVALVNRCNIQRGGLAYSAASADMRQRCPDLFLLANRAPRLSNRQALPGEEEMRAVADALADAFRNRPRGMGYESTLAKFRRENPGFWETFATSIDYADAGLPEQATPAQITGAFNGLLNHARRAAGFDFQRGWNHVRVGWPDLFIIANRLPSSQSAGEGMVAYSAVSEEVQQNAERIRSQGLKEDADPECFPMHVTEKIIRDFFWNCFNQARGKHGFTWEAAWEFMRKNCPRTFAQYCYWS